MREDPLTQTMFTIDENDENDASVSIVGKVNQCWHPFLVDDTMKLQGLQKKLGARKISKF